MSDALTDEELIELTGYKYHALQCAELKKKGISFIPNKEGRPTVTWTHINAFLNGLSQDGNSSQEARPNFEAI